MKNKLNKGKTIGIVAASLAAVSLLGVGYSSWIIQHKAETTISNVSVSVADVTDSGIDLSDASVANSTSLKFDADSTTTSSGLITASEGASCNMSITVTFNATIYGTPSGYTSASGSSSASLSIYAYLTATKSSTDSTDATTEFTACATKNYITNPNNLNIGTTGSTSATLKSLPTASSTTTGVTEYMNCSVTFAWGWGSAFGGKNPVAITESDLSTTNTDCTSDSVNKVKTALKSLQGSLNGLNITITLSPVALTSSK